MTKTEMVVSNFKKTYNITDKKIVIVVYSFAAIVIGAPVYRIGKAWISNKRLGKLDD